MVNGECRAYLATDFVARSKETPDGQLLEETLVGAVFVTQRFPVTLRDTSLFAVNKDLSGVDGEAYKKYRRLHSSGHRQVSQSNENRFSARGSRLV